MLCSVCKKNTAVIYINKIDDSDPSGNSKNEVEALCLECAKKRGINPLNNVLSNLNNVSKEDMENMAEQFNKFMENIDPQALEKFERNFDFSNMFDNNTDVSNLFINNDVPEENIKNKENNKQENNDKKQKEKKKPLKTKYLDTYGINLTQKAREKKLDKVIGRDIELQRMIQILNRRSKNNPALIGEPGVGKTAIVNALALAISDGNVPNKLLNKEVYLLDMTALVAGTQFRGQFESRVKGIIDECASFGNIILAIDELHNIVGGLEHDNSMNVANMLKPALANGSIQVIGATTLKEYRKSIEKDTALERRFQSIIVEEPSHEDCFNILKGIKSYYEDYHKVIIENDILKKCVYLSDKYIHDRFLPDKAIDLLDEACSRVNLDDIILAKITKLQSAIDELNDEENSLTENIDNKDNVENFEKAAKIKEKKCKFETELKTLNGKLKPRKVTFDDVARVVELWTKIPVSKIQTSEADKLLNLEKNLKKRIVGQDHAVKLISNAILRKRAGIKTIEKPPSFIFVGPTGVGKTALVKALAYELFDSEDSIIKLDMSEYMESHSVSKLIGSPPGYVGYDEAGNLTEKVRRNPYSIILFDEIEKAHQNIYNLLLQILDEGKLTDSQGKTVSFKHTVVVLTSNLGTSFKNDSYGFSNQKIDKEILNNKVYDSLKEFFTPEFLNRIDEIVIFNKLTKNNITSITDNMLKELKEDVKKKNITLTYTDAVVAYIIQKGFSDKYGARPIKRAIQKYIEDMIAIEYIKGNIQDKSKIDLDVINDNVIIHT